jgi:cyanate permease
MMIVMLMTYYIPFFYQAKGRTAEQSGIDILPFMMSLVAGSGLGGYLNKVTGVYKPYMIVGSMLYAIAGGLFFTIDESTPDVRIIGFQIILGFGSGIAFQQPCASQFEERFMNADCRS